MKKRTLLLAFMVAALAVSGCVAEDGPRAEFVVDFADAHPDDVTEMRETIHFDNASRPAADLYTDVEAEHPDAYTVHDLTVAWAQAGDVAIETTYYDCCGFSLESIDGVAGWYEDGEGAFWELSINGEAADQGMGTTLVEDGDEVRWAYTPIAS